MYLILQNYLHYCNKSWTVKMVWNLCIVYYSTNLLKNVATLCKNFEINWPDFEILVTTNKFSINLKKI